MTSKIAAVVIVTIVTMATEHCILSAEASQTCC